MPDNAPPNRTQNSSLGAGVADKLDRSRLSNAFQRRFTIDGQIQRGEAYIDGSRILIEEYRHLMSNGDKAIARDTHERATYAREKLDTGDVPTIQRFRDAREFKGLSKKAYRVSKRASDRALDHSVLGRSGGTGPPARPSSTAPEESGGTDPQAGPPPVTSKEPPGPLPHNPSAESHGAATSSRGEWVRDTQMTTLPSGDADTERPMDETQGTATSIYEPSKATSEITLASYKTAMDWIPDATMTTLSTGDASIEGPIDEVPETFEYDESLATSGTSITSYKTEKTVNSRKSRYNVLPRHKYADHGYLRPQVPGSLGGTSLPKTELRDEHIDDDDESPPSPQSAPPTSPGPNPGTRPFDGPADTEHVHGDTWSQTPTPRQWVELLTANPAGLTDGDADSESVSTVSDVDVFGSDSEAGAD